MLLFVMILLWLPPVQVAEKGGPFRGLRLAFADRPFLTYTGFMGGRQFMAAQFSITLPLVAVAIAGNAGAVAFGGGLGNVAGGLLYDVGRRLEAPALPWLIFAAIGRVAAAGLWWTLLGDGALGNRGWRAARRHEP